MLKTSCNKTIVNDGIETHGKIVNAMTIYIIHILHLLLIHTYIFRNINHNTYMVNGDINIRKIYADMLFTLDMEERSSGLKLSALNKHKVALYFIW